jgi:membrane-associated phospholipid phosphatase
VRRAVAALIVSGVAIRVVALLIGIFLTGRHGRGPVQGMDLAVGQWFLHHRGPLVGVSRFVATWFDAAPLAALASVVAAVMFVRSRSVVAALPLIAYLGGEFQVFAIREVIHRHRPSSANYPHAGALPGIHETSFSFPSGHAVAVTALLFALFGYFAIRRRIWWPYLVASFASAFVGYTRLVLGVHWMSDVVFGLLAGIAWGIVAALSFHRLDIVTSRDAAAAGYSFQ